MTVPLMLFSIQYLPNAKQVISTLQHNVYYHIKGFVSKSLGWTNKFPAALLTKPSTTKCSTAVLRTFSTSS
jgi:hypothetical protein